MSRRTVLPLSTSLALAAAVALTACGGSKPSTADQDAKASCAAVSRGAFQPPGSTVANTAKDRTAHRLSAGAGLAAAAAVEDRYAELGRTTLAAWHSVKTLDFTKAALQRQAALATCASLKLPHDGSDAGSAKDDATAACAALTRKKSDLLNHARPTYQTVQRVAAAADLADASAIGDGGYAALTGPARALNGHVKADPAAAATDLRSALSACADAKLPH